ncbi:GFA family protein [Croceicoccus ponticola]|uniref:GFA family protein n=1 Tax=Croceicoccus ponticola TaxID=2217664 RepID=A0A437H098_9SPHN|nr:GFA family protein [Croceicoccus ponticola]RVQ69034.1 GFA family protein [Croceicoccus ponticola]
MTGTDIRDVSGACHCGGVGFVAKVDLGSARRCNCSICRMRGAVAVGAKLADFELTRGEDLLTLYTFNTGEAKHYFCRRCGIYTHHQRRSDPTQYGINVACIDGVSPFDFTEVIVNEGVRHPNDGGGGVAGILRYEPTES